MLRLSTGLPCRCSLGPQEISKKLERRSFINLHPSFPRRTLRSGASPWRVFDIDQLKVTETRCLPSHNTPDEPVSLSFGQALTNDQDMTILYT
jgi:hypothetical protein